MTPLFFTDRSNANRRAKLMISKGKAPTSQYKIEKRGEREFELVWTFAHPNSEAPDVEPEEPEDGDIPNTGETATIAPPANPNAKPPAALEPGDPPAFNLAAQVEQLGADSLLPPAGYGTRASRRQERKTKAEARKVRIQASQAAAAPSSAPDETVKRGPRGSYITNLPPGAMPAKPVIASATNQAYQRHIDALADLAEEGKWDEIAAYEVSQSKQSYATMLRKYHERLLAARPATA